MHATVILSHGTDSGPEATKVSALARVAEAMCWRTQRPDFREDDALGLAGSVSPRVTRLVAIARAAGHPLVLAGSSMGAFVSGLASLEVPCEGLFLVALPTVIPRYPEHFDMRRNTPAMLVHGWRDDLCAPEPTLTFARERGLPALVLDDEHRLSNHVPAIERQFRLFLESLSA